MCNLCLISTIVSVILLVQHNREASTLAMVITACLVCRGTILAMLIHTGIAELEFFSFPRKRQDLMSHRLTFTPVMLNVKSATLQHFPQLQVSRIVQYLLCLHVLALLVMQEKQK